MIYRIVVPNHNAAFRGGTITRWHVSDGGEVGFGGDLFDVEVNQIVALRHTKRASMLARSKRRFSRLANEYDERQPRGVVTIRVSSAEPHVVARKLLIPEGADVEVNQSVALVSLAQGTELPVEPDEIESLPMMRTAVNVVDPAEL